MRYSWHVGVKEIEVREAGTGREVFAWQVPASFTRWSAVTAVLRCYGRRLAAIEAGFNIWVNGEWCYREVPNGR